MEMNIEFTCRDKVYTFTDWKSFWECVLDLRDRMSWRKNDEYRFKAEIKTETSWTLVEEKQFLPFYRTLMDMQLNRCKKQFEGYSHYENQIAAVALSFIPNTNKQEFMDALFRAVANSIHASGTNEYFNDMFVPELIEAMYQQNMDGSDVKTKYENIVKPMVDALLDGHNRFEAGETTEIASTPIAMMHELSIIEDMQSMLELKKKDILKVFMDTHKDMGHAMNRLIGERNY